MTNSTLIELPGLRFDLVYEDVYHKDSDIYQKSIFYLQIVQIWKKFNILRSSGNENPSAKLLEESFLNDAPTFAKNLFEYYDRKLFTFNPQFIVRAPTRNEDLQENVFVRFAEELALKNNNLSQYFTKDADDQIVLIQNISKLIGHNKRILIVDDTYASGRTVLQIAMALGLEHRYIVVCPLRVDEKNRITE